MREHQHEFHQNDDGRCCDKERSHEVHVQTSKPDFNPPGQEKPATQQYTTVVPSRSDLKKEYLSYRAAARSLCGGLTGVTVSDHAAVQVTTDRDGAFVEAVIWVPREKIEPRCRQCDKQTTGFDEYGPLCIDCAMVTALREGR